MLRIYIQDRPLIIIDSDEEKLGETGDIALENGQLSDIKPLIRKLEGGELLGALIVCESTDEAMNTLKSEMRIIQAAGGMVYTPDNDVLLIFRKGKWDLPKGKLDEGEDLAACALREIEEETGAHDLNIIQPITTTYHTYHEKGEYILKESHWFLVHSATKSALHPQLEEDILESKWVPLNEVTTYKANMHASVKDVIDAGLILLNEAKA